MGRRIFNHLGEIRRSQVLEYGPGAIINFTHKSGAATASYMTSGLTAKKNNW